MANNTTNTKESQVSSLKSKVRSMDYTKWLVLSISLLVISYSYLQTIKPLLTERERIIERTYYVNELQNSILSAITLSQLRNVQDFDTINKQTSALQDQLINISLYQGIQNSQPLHEKVKELIHIVNLQNQLIEKFKSSRAILQNSNNYLPNAYRQCHINIKNQNLQNIEEIETLNTTLEESLISGLTITHSRDSFTANKLKANINSLKLSPINEPCNSFIQHSEILANYLPESQLNFDQIHLLQLNLKIHEFYLLLESQTSQAIENNNFYYLIITLFALLLLAYVIWTLTSLYRTNTQLNTALSKLSEQQGLFSALIQSNNSIAKNLEQQTLFQEICDIIIEETKLDSCWISLIDENSQTTTPLACAGVARDEILGLRPSLVSNSPTEQGTIAEAYNTGKAVITNDYQSRMKATHWATSTKQWQIKGSATLPIKVNNKIIGFLVTYTLDSDFFNEKINSLLKQLAHNIGTAIHNAQIADIQKQHQKDLALAAIAFESQEAIIITNAHAQIIRTNQAFSKITGFTQAEAITQTPAILKSGLHNQDFYDQLWSELKENGQWQGEIWNRKKDGTLYPCWQTISSLLDENGQVSHYISHSMDLTKDKASQREINYLNNHDHLTKLPNRNLLIERIEQQLGQNQAFYSLLLTINLQRFKSINESLGHAAGDELLIQTANRLQELSFEKVYDITLARVGSDEFCMLCLTDYEDLKETIIETGLIAIQIQHLIAQELDLLGNKVVMNSTIGVTTFRPNKASQSNRTAEELIQEGNTALQRAKQNTIASIQFYEDHMQQQAQQRLHLETDLRKAVQQQQFILHYQPQHSIDDGTITGFEALLRWQNNDGDLVAPLNFIPVLEETGLILPVGYWIIQQAIVDAKILHQTNPEYTVSVNLSALQFNDEKLIEKVSETLHQLDYPAERLEFEITESLLMSDIEQTVTKLNQLTELGVKIAIDDFGTGYSSLSYLKRFPVNRLKIDKSFIDDITDPNDADSAIVKATIQMANALSIQTIAEGVEEIEQVSTLSNLGCKEAQGYHFSKPLAFNELQHYIQTK